MHCSSCGQENRENARFCDGCGAPLEESSVSIEQSNHGLNKSKGFVGRRRELDELIKALEDALSGRGRMVMLVGEPGIGKTRTAEELACHALDAGAQVLWGHCYEGEGAPPYWPWIQPLRFYVQATDPDQLSIQMGPGAADIAEIVPEIRDKLPGLSVRPSLGFDQARFRLFESVCILLKNAAQIRPLVLVLEDLHWADRPSLMLLEFIAREMEGIPLLIIGSYRDAEVSQGSPLAQTLGDIVRQNVFRRLTLTGLNEKEVGELFETTSGISPSPESIRAIHGRTEGNPLFVRELTRMLGKESSIEGADQLLSIPEGIKETIGRRISRVSEECHQVLVTASIIGREFDFSVLSALKDEISEDQLLRVVDEALDLHLIDEVPSAIERYQFSHALIQETLAQEPSVSRRVRLHARIGEALEELYGSDMDAHASTLAFHFGRAASVIGDRKMVHYCLLAGEQALAAYAHEEAMEHFQRALGVRDGQPMDTEIASLLSGLGMAQAATVERHRIHEVIDTLSRALDYFTENKDIDRAVAIAEYPFYPLLGQRTGNSQLIASALALVPPESPEAGRLLSRYGRVMGTEEGEYDTAEQAFNQALEIARKTQNTRLELQTLAEAANVDMLFTRFSESLRKVDQAIPLTRLIEDLPAEALARYTAVLDHLALGNLAGMRRHALPLIKISDRLRDRFWQTLAIRCNEDIAHLTGNWAVACDYSDQGLQLSPDECRNLSTRTMLEFQTGNPVEGRAYLERLLQVAANTPPGPTLEHALVALTAPLVTRICGEDHFLAEAETATKAVFSTESRLTYMDWDARTALALLAENRSDADLARQQYQLLLPYAGTVLLFVMVSTDRMLGILAKTMGNLDLAIEHFDSSLGFCRDAGYLPEIAWACCDCSDVLVQRNFSGDQERARTLLQESLSISTDLGMPPLQQRCQVRLDRLDSLSTSPSYPGGLSKREVEVLRLIAAGKSNREIAEDLVISLNTVANHVSNILIKTDAANRTEAATFAIRHNLVESY